jgi:hypothetical protein
MYTEKDFDKELGKFSDDITQLSDKFLKLKNLKDEIQGINSKKGLLNRKLFFLSFGSLETRMQKFKDAMNEKPQDNIEDIEAEIIPTSIKNTLQK